METFESLVIQACGAEHASLIANMSRQSFYETFAISNTEEDMTLFLENQFSQQMLEEEVTSGKHLFFLATINNEPAGYFKLTLHQHPELPSAMKAIEIGRFYAMNNFIGKGVGRSMMHYVLSFAANMGVEQVWLGVWEQNHRAIRFYEAFGFQIFSKHHFQLGRDLQNDWLMYRLL